MIRKTLIVLSMLFGVFGMLSISVAQPVDPVMAKQSADILSKLRKVELLYQILPLLLEKQQIDKILPALEKIRSKQRKLLEQEHKDLAGFETDANKAVAAGVGGQMPSDDTIRTIEAFYKANDLRRQVAMGENLDLLMPVLKSTLNAGQMKVMANSLTMAFFEPDLAPGDINDEVKARVFAREVLLDPLTYEILVAMDK
jgi:hypothetical protein